MVMTDDVFSPDLQRRLIRLRSDAADLTTVRENLVKAEAASKEPSVFGM